MDYASLFLAVLATALAADGEVLLTVNKDVLVARGAIAARVSARGFTVIAPEHRDARFSNHPWRVSLGAMVAGNEAVMVHVERVIDGSGASNYSKLATSDWPWPGAHMREMCAEVNPADVDEEHDLAYLRDRGWDPSGSIALEQHFITTDDHNQEIVVSLLIRSVHCDDKAELHVALDKLRAKVSVCRDSGGRLHP